MIRRVIHISVIAALVASFVLPSATAKSKKAKKSILPGCWGVGCAPKPNGEVDPDAQMLIWKLSHNPELMNTEYLKYFIGRPEKEQHQKSSATPHYYWHDAQERLTYELEQTQRIPGEVVQSQMTVHLDGMGLTFDKLKPVYGEPVKRFYDFRAQPAELYTFAPNTYLSFSSPPNTFRVNEAKIVYNGAPLPQPSPTEMASAQAAMIAKSAVIGSNDDEPITAEALPLLQARVKTQPMDPEAHLKLADAYRQQSQLHPAIGEYKLALALSNSNGNVRDRAISALRQMRVIDDSYDPDAKRKLELVHQGQALKAGSVQHKPQQPQQPPNAAQPL